MSILMTSNDLAKFQNRQPHKAQMLKQNQGLVARLHKLLKQVLYSVLFFPVDVPLNIMQLQKHHIKHFLLGGVFLLATGSLYHYGHLWYSLTHTLDTRQTQMYHIMKHPDEGLISNPRQTQIQHIMKQLDEGFISKPGNCKSNVEVLLSILKTQLLEYAVN